jgi:hypothetical protein
MKKGYWKRYKRKLAKSDARHNERREKRKKSISYRVKKVLKMFIGKY